MYFAHTLIMHNIKTLEHGGGCRFDTFIPETLTSSAI